MKITYHSLFNDFRTSLSALYDCREIRAIYHAYFQLKWHVASYDLVLRAGDYLPENISAAVQGDLYRLSCGEPLQYVVGKAVFMDLDLEVCPAVLIPRPETEELVQLVLSDAKRDPSVLDIGTGSGAIAIAVATKMTGSTLFATDFSEEAIAVAQRNSDCHHADVSFLLHDILHDNDNLLPYDLDVIVSNPPYIPLSKKKMLHTNVADFEPAAALFVPDEDALLFYRRITEMAVTHLNENGCLYFETYEDYHTQLQTLLKTNGFEAVECLDDMNGKPRFIKAKKNND